MRAVAVEENYSIIGNIDNALKPAEPIKFLAPTAANTVQPGVTPPATTSAAPEMQNKTGFRWWWALPILAVLGLLGFLPRLFRKPTP